jgi:hypothetical protein
MAPSCIHFRSGNYSKARLLICSQLVLLAIGPTRSDPTCIDKQLSLPHAVVRSNPKQSERIWASGNERTEAILPNWGVNNAGYHVRREDRFSAILDFMNDSHDQDKLIYFTMVYDIVKDSTDNLDDVKVVWLDVENCLLSEIPPLKEIGETDARFESPLIVSK